MQSTVAKLMAPRHIEFVEEELPELMDGDLLCETLVSAISTGTEIAAYVGLPPLRPSAAYPRLLGYCNVSRVTDSRSDKFQVGDRVLTFQSHRSAFVVNYTGVLLRLPDQADARHISTSYLFHLGYNAVVRSQAQIGARVVVIGLGVIGLACVAMASLAGCRVDAVSDHADLSVVTAFGANNLLRRPYSGPAAEVVLLTTNSWGDWQMALKAAGKFGTIAVLGFPGRGQPAPQQNPLPTEDFYDKQLRIEAVGLSPEYNDSRGFLPRNERDNIAFIAGKIMDGTLKPDLLISGAFPARRIEDAYKRLIDRERGALTYVLDWPR
ncbi:zinc-dependent alcohol dehydrogenase [Methylobacterium sp. PvR107]|uniref:zinc-dependent alcohol dehydrogenase n=1 Tax=Methylobacterium sp. PvR107 TaxID=2806597 RepID=UPI001AE4345E|nr:zinc-binding alcohol dehydrogenase [Methylobacterium sp. PvR107]MBP1178516.1 threonine dehydrogenase-like Zn-dependent dehydrogenase [Methylobacterium sp. PvR107]